MKKVNWKTVINFLSHGINSCSQLIVCTELLKEGRLP